MAKNRKTSPSPAPARLTAAEQHKALNVLFIVLGVVWLANIAVLHYEPLNLATGVGMLMCIGAQGLRSTKEGSDE